MIVWRACTTSVCVFFTVVKRSSYGRMAFPILAFTSSLVVWYLYKIPRSLRKHLISNACIRLSMSAVMVHVSHAYKNMDMARERISLILELMAMFLSFQMNFSLVSAAVVWAILDSTSGLDPSSDTIAPRYLKLWMVSSFLFFMVMSVLMPLVLFVISWVFSALICIPYAVEASSRWFTNLASSCSCPARPWARASQVGKWSKCQALQAKCLRWGEGGGMEMWGWSPLKKKKRRNQRKTKNKKEWHRLLSCSFLSLFSVLESTKICKYGPEHWNYQG